MWFIIGFLYFDVILDIKVKFYLIEVGISGFFFDIYSKLSR